MKHLFTSYKTLVLPALVFATAALSARAQAPDASPSATPTNVSTIVIIGQRIPGATVVVPTPELQLRDPDTASLLNQIPGAAVVRNGALTGIAQLRGLSGDRVKTLVDGMAITPACPFYMDPPLHYSAPSSLHKLTVLPGITPVSLGGDSIGGTVLAEPAPPRFATDDHPLWSSDLGSFYRSSNDGYGFNGEFALANKDLGAAYSGSWETGDDLRFPGGRARDTAFDEFVEQEGRIAGKLLGGLLEAYGGISRTRNAGTPAVPMDMITDDSWRVGLRQTGEYEFAELDSRIAFHSIDHLMNNYSLRPLAPGAPRLFSPATSDDLSGQLAAVFPRDKNTFRAGVDFHWNAFDAFVQNADNGRQQNTLNDANRTRIGSYLEWQTNWSDQWTSLVGVRNDTVWSDTDNIETFFPPAAADAAAFNAQSHYRIFPDFDAMVSVRYKPGEHSNYELAFARKTRAPSLLELYLYTPFAASAGASDGRTYLGNLGLDPEVSHQVALTGDWHGDGWEMKVTPYYNFVSDYIQGTPINRFVNGLPVLQYENVNRADLYGVDAEAHYDLTNEFSLHAQLSYVRGIDRDNGDNLYQIPPLHGIVSLEYDNGAWHGAVEGVLAARQDKVSAYNGETPSPGYALLNLRAGYTFREHLNVELSLENLVDKRYANHLAGVNRVLDSDVPVGARLPSAGRSVAVSVKYDF